MNTYFGGVKCVIRKFMDMAADKSSVCGRACVLEVVFRAVVKSHHTLSIGNMRSLTQEYPAFGMTNVLRTANH
jgi:hypothetical protein